MMPSLAGLRDLIPFDKGPQLVLALALLLLGYAFARLARSGLLRLAHGRLSPQQAMIAGRVVFYLIFSIALAEALHHAGIDLSVALGAAGLLTVAIGFAAQTSTSNLISGLFLVAEKPFVLGDFIQVGSTLGEVLSIDPLSVKLRTLDNLLVRIPNENLLKSEIKNLSAFPIRRLDLAIDVAYGCDLENVRAELERLAAAEPLCLVEPRPVFQALAFGESAIQLRLSVWTTTQTQLEARTALLLAIHRRFREVGIDIPYPHRVMVVPQAAATPSAGS